MGNVTRAAWRRRAGLRTLRRDGFQILELEKQMRRGSEDGFQAEIIT